MRPPTRSASGYTTWRLIADQLRSEIADGRRAPGSKLPSEGELAKNFSVNRNTVRQSIASLAEDGVVETKRGRGTFVVPHKLLVHRIGVRTRLSNSAGPDDGSAIRPISAQVVAQPPRDVVTHLELGERPALQMETIADVRGTTIARATHWFDLALTPDLDVHLRQTRSITKSLRALGIDDYVRTWSVVSARTATAEEASHLNLTPGAIVLVVRAVDALLDGRLLQFTSTRFRADQVELDIDLGTHRARGPDDVAD
ncbi:phosphonate metabolism transcriptional regulator PhnF [Skermania sp. ID1734]|jgi:GntR family phosphonate transport system transcriptional regulator|uniref:phosphonate metabolism transcriptional regulator PhnF n=1 Tax=Skermania sp. ID1734 TaxID=2597516 RepID=UPI000EAE0990|nr:phosphonate metabolism transcriptional regulator PhnF [Skermania sp. ID1734]TSD92927.1 phosphonate metabolism transcriptional regulator PhnF [Skermania sp. ID1734]